MLLLQTNSRKRESKIWTLPTRTERNLTEEQQRNTLNDDELHSTGYESAAQYGNNYKRNFLISLSVHVYVTTLFKSRVMLVLKVLFTHPRCQYKYSWKWNVAKNEIRNFILSQRRSWDIRSAGILHRVTEWLERDISRRSCGLTIKGRMSIVHFFPRHSTAEEETTALYRQVRKLSPTEEAQYPRRTDIANR